MAEEVVPGYKYILNPSRVNNPKDHLKTIFIRLLWELFYADAPDNFGI